MVNIQHLFVAYMENGKKTNFVTIISAKMWLSKVFRINKKPIHCNINFAKYNFKIRKNKKYFQKLSFEMAWFIGKTLLSTKISKKIYTKMLYRR